VEHSPQAIARRCCDSSDNPSPNRLHEVCGCKQPVARADNPRQYIWGNHSTRRNRSLTEPAPQRSTRLSPGACLSISEISATKTRPVLVTYFTMPDALHGFRRNSTILRDDRKDNWRLPIDHTTERGSRQQKRSAGFFSRRCRHLADRVYLRSVPAGTISALRRSV